MRVNEWIVSLKFTFTYCQGGQFLIKYGSSAKSKKALWAILAHLPRGEARLPMARNVLRVLILRNLHLNHFWCKGILVKLVNDLI